MTEAEIRQVIADALVYASVPYLRGSNLATQFVSGETDVKMQQLEMDSLAAMELCIAIEVNIGVSIIPSELSDLDALSGLSAMIRERLAEGDQVHG